MTKKQKQPKLLPCPCCGKMPKLKDSSIGIIYCSNIDGCILGDNMEFDYSMKHEAIKAWNTRAKVKK